MHSVLLLPACSCESALELEFYSTNIGNQLSLLAFTIYKAHLTGKCVCVRAVGTARKIPLLRGIENVCWSPDEIDGVCEAKVIEETDMPCSFWSHGNHMMNVTIPLRNAVLPLLPPCPSNELVVHFRCGDAPFDRNPGYGLLRDAYYHDAVDRLNAHNAKRVVLLHCFNHWDPGEKIDMSREEAGVLVAAYKSHILQLLKRICPNATVVTECGTIDGDFSSMVHADKFIGSTSSMSRIAAILRDGPAVVPTNAPYWIRPGTNPTLTHLTELSFDEYVVKHDRIPDYRDVDAVLKKLSS